MKRVQRFASFAAAICIVAVALAGCATILSGSSAAVNVKSSPAGAEVVIKSSAGIVVYEGITPAELKLSKKNEYQVTVTLDGYKSKTVAISHSGIQSTAFCNLLSLVGWGIDYVTGAMNKLEPQTVSVKLQTASVDGKEGLYTVFVFVDAEGKVHSGAVRMERL